MPVTKTMLLRQEKELAQFADKDYLSEWRKAERTSDSSVKIETYDGSIWTVVRDLNFLSSPPRIWKDGKEISVACEDGSNWNPGLSSAKWLLMIMVLPVE